MLSTTQAVSLIRTLLDCSLVEAVNLIRKWYTSTSDDHYWIEFYALVSKINSLKIEQYCPRSYNDDSSNF